MTFKKFTEDLGKKRKITIYEMSSVKFLRISGLKFSGHYSASANGEFWIAWSDAYVLKKNACYFGQGNQILLSGEGQRPEYGKVANNGTFIINDNPRNRTGSTFYAIDNNGNTLIQHKFEEFVQENGISEDGNFAACESMGVLYFFDLYSRSLLWQIKPECGRGYTTYLLDTEKKHLHIQLECRDERSYRYDFEGNFIDKEKWEEERITYGTVEELYLIAKELLTAAGRLVSQDKVDEVFSVINRALAAKEIDRSPQYKAIFYRMLGEVYDSQYDTDRAIENFKWALQFELNPRGKAKIYRMLGEVYESQYDIDQAIENFESALQFDPKVGVKKKLKKLEELQTDHNKTSRFGKFN